MKISILTLFPDLFPKILESSILGRAKKKGLVEYSVVDIRKFGEGKHQTVDDRPYGGGAGMVLKPDVLTRAAQSAASQKSYIILTSASGRPFNQKKASEFSKLPHVVIICGHYEGVDQRFIDKYVDEEISIGDYVLTGGELPALVMVDSITRLIPGVLEKPEAIKEESFSMNSEPIAHNLLEYPQYTRPEEFEKLKVPEVLLSGSHQKIKEWRMLKSQEKTKKVRPDLLS